ncbi:MAG: electron transfer flavoprotein beta subunit/FixA family protein [Propionibacteriaceae bacterium]|jgi:electron transfer flavoprotein beta subunit|nr:electron transfer flavoprotein beta subunit/FixA family protein [Propionibacteriaceae bacterium]
MKIVVTYQWAPDPAEASVGSDGKVDFSRAKSAVSDYDATAIQVGRALADATGAALIGVSVGGPAAGTPVATKAALSRGLDEVLVVADPTLEGAGTLTTAKVIAAVVKSLGDVALVVTGDSSIDTGARMTAPVLGGLLGWPVVTDAKSVELAGAAITVSRVLPEGVQTLSVAGPAVIASSADASKPKAPGMKDVMAAAKKPAAVKAPADFGIALAPEGAVKSTGKVSGSSRKGVRIDTSDPAAAAAELVSALRTTGVLS